MVSLGLKVCERGRANPPPLSSTPATAGFVDISMTRDFHFSSVKGGAASSSCSPGLTTLQYLFSSAASLTADWATIKPHSARTQKRNWKMIKPYLLFSVAGHSKKKTSSLCEFSWRFFYLVLSRFVWSYFSQASESANHSIRWRHHQPDFAVLHAILWY